MNNHGRKGATAAPNVTRPRANAVSAPNVTRPRANAVSAPSGGPQNVGRNANTLPPAGQMQPLNMANAAEARRQATKPQSAANDNQSVLRPA